MEELMKRLQYVYKELARHNRSDVRAATNSVARAMQELEDLSADSKAAIELEFAATLAAIREKEERKRKHQEGLDRELAELRIMRDTQAKVLKENKARAEAKAAAKKKSAAARKKREETKKPPKRKRKRKKRAE